MKKTSKTHSFNSNISAQRKLNYRLTRGYNRLCRRHTRLLFSGRTMLWAYLSVRYIYMRIGDLWFVCVCVFVKDISNSVERTTTEIGSCAFSF